MAALIMILTITAFGVVHSVLAGRSVKAWFRRRVGDRLYEGFYRLAYNALATLTLAPVAALLVLAPGAESWRIEQPAIVALLWALRLAGAAGLTISLLQVDLGRFLGLSQAAAYLAGRPLPLPPEPLQTGGFYAWVRHPLYSFSLIALWAAPVMTEAFLGLNIAATVYFIVGSLLEEKRLLAAFGESYRAYQRQVPWLLPLRIPRRNPQALADAGFEKRS